MRRAQVYHPDTAETFDFDCPNCRRRLRIRADQRNQPIECLSCAIVLPGPAYRRGQLDVAPPAPPRPYECRCPTCELAARVSDADVGALTRCGRCQDWFEQPPPPWEQWRRPVARVFTRRDRLGSLFHLMLSRDLARWPDAQLDPPSRRLFEFYCGRCGHVQIARVWDIASQQRCGDCQALFVVPSPPHRRASRAAARVDLWEGRDPPQPGR